MASEWTIYRTKPFGKTYGVCLPLFHEDADFSLANLSVYSDGLWEYRWSGILASSFAAEVRKGEAAVFPAQGDKFFFALMGYGTMTETEWTSTADEVLRRANAISHSLNPLSKNLVTLYPDGFYRRGKPEWTVALRLFARRYIGRQGKKTQESGLSTTAVPPDTTAYYVNTAGDEVTGISLPVFACQKDVIYLTQWFLFTDGMSRIGGDGPILTEGETNELWATNTLCMAVPPSIWIHVDGLGKFRSADARWWVKPAERQKEARDEIAMLNGAPGAQATCIQRWEDYEADPTEANKEMLRQAYEAVPEHRQIFCAHDMDAKDWPIRRILGLGARNY